MSATSWPCAGTARPVLGDADLHLRDPCLRSRARAAGTGRAGAAEAAQRAERSLRAARVDAGHASRADRHRVLPIEQFGEIRLSADGVLQTPTNVFQPGTPEAIALAAANTAATIILDDGRTGQNLNLLDNGDDYLPYVRAGDTLRIGDQLLGHTAVLHFGFSAWRLQPVDIDAITDELAANRTRPRDEDPPDVGGNLKVASFNVLNYFNGDGQGGGFPTTRGAVTASELERQTEKLVDAITRLRADVYGLIEIENDGGEFQAARTLVDALNAEVGPDTYRFVDTGVIGTDEIKQAFIYDRRTVRPVGDWAILTSAVDPRFNDDLSRPALAQTFVRLGSGERVTVVVNHLKSKSQAA